MIKSESVAESEGITGNETPPVSFYLKQRKIFINLIVMTITWLSASFGYYLLLPLTNSFDNVYRSALSSSVAEISAYLLSGVFAVKFGVKPSMVISFLISTLGGLLILIFGSSDENAITF